ncbi:hypothetical protein LguiB_005393 [Lonicera macranthoides]
MLNLQAIERWIELCLSNRKTPKFRSRTQTMCHRTDQNFIIASTDVRIKGKSFKYARLSNPINLLHYFQSGLDLDLNTRYGRKNIIYIARTRLLKGREGSSATNFALCCGIEHIVADLVWNSFTRGDSR